MKLQKPNQIIKAIIVSSIVTFIVTLNIGCQLLEEKLEDGITVTNQDTTYWTNIDWTTADSGSYANFKSTAGLAPSCSNAPDTDPKFTFSVKRGSTSKILIFMEGGGACWHYNNCSGILANTPASINNMEGYSPEIMFDMTTSYLNKIGNQNIDAVALGYGGIFDFINTDNPFKDWTFVFLPYCTADLHTGDADTTYTDPTNAANQITIRHRGHANFSVAMEWIKNNYPNATDIVTAGASAGAYGAIINFPFVQDAYPSANHTVIIDAGGAVISTDFQQNGLSNWNMQLPNSTTIPGTAFIYFDQLNPTTIDFTTLTQTVANHYTGASFGQHNSYWDKLQVMFYNVMLNITNKLSWVSYEGVWCDWQTAMTSIIDNTNANVNSSNYTFYMGTGDGHTMLKYDDFYNMSANGSSMVSWVNNLMNKTAANVDCRQDAGDPMCGATQTVIDAALVCGP